MISVLGIHWKGWCSSWNSNTLATWWEELAHLKRPWCWERLRAGGEGDARGWDGWMASPTQWAWVWVDSESWWWTGRPGMLQFMGLQGVRYDWVNGTELMVIIFPLWFKSPYFKNPAFYFFGFYMLHRCTWWVGFSWYSDWFSMLPEQLLEGRNGSVFLFVYLNFDCTGVSSYRALERAQ